MLLAACAYPAWQEYDYQQAISEARAAGFTWVCDDPISSIRRDWHNALSRETWSTHQRDLECREIPNLARYRRLFQRLRPTDLWFDGFHDENLDAFKDITSLRRIVLINCTALKNLDDIKGLTSLRNFQLLSCHGLQNVDALDALTNLQLLSLYDNPVLQKVDVLKRLTGLQMLDLEGCIKITAASLRELRAALPNTEIIFPDGTKSPPQ